MPIFIQILDKGLAFVQLETGVLRTTQWELYTGYAWTHWALHGLRVDSLSISRTTRGLIGFVLRTPFWGLVLRTPFWGLGLSFIKRVKMSSSQWTFKNIYFCSLIINYLLFNCFVLVNYLCVRLKIIYSIYFLWFH